MQCLTENNNLNEVGFREIEQSISIQQTLTSPLLKKITNDIHSLRQTGRLISAIIERYAMQLNTHKEVDSRQFTVMALDLIELFANETLEDIILLFKYARNGKYGYRARFDISVVMEWVPQYLEYKAIAREEMIQKQKAERDLNQERIPMSEKSKKMLRQFIQKSQADKALKKDEGFANSPLNSSKTYSKALEKRPSQMSFQQYAKLKKSMNLKN